MGVLYHIDPLLPCVGGCKRKSYSWLAGQDEGRDRYEQHDTIKWRRNNKMMDNPNRIPGPNPFRLFTLFSTMAGMLRL